MYLTRMALNPSRRGTRHLLGSPQRMHAAVMSAFPPAAEPGRVLWRVDRPAGHRLTLYVVSAAKPDLTGVVEQAGWPTAAAWDTTTYDPFLSRLDAGQAWRFRLTANPVQSKAGQRGTRGKVLAHVTAAQQEQWLRDHAGRWGFTLPDASEGGGVLVTGRGADVFDRRDPDGDARRRVTITRAQFDGVLTVTDPDALRAALVGGMGRAKAYGCGLMTLAAAR